MNINKATIEEEAIALVRGERSEWEPMETNLTEKIRFQGRNIIKRARKNYFSIFDKEFDPVTNRKKLFVPLTRDMVETTVKNIDIDTKDIQVRAKNPAGYNLAILTRYILGSYLDKMRFGQILNRTIRKAGVEGVAVLKKTKFEGKVGIKLLENLNFYTDPTANYLCESSGNIEDNYLTIDEARSYTDWSRLDDLIGTTSIERIPNISLSTSIPYVGVTERWGLMPKYFLTTNKEKDKELIEGVIIISNISGGPIVQLIAENKSGKRPYQEFRTKMYDGRWLGLGIGEDLFDLQSYINEIFNMRLNTNRIKQLGLFQIRKGSGITPQSLNQLHGTHGIQVSRINQDIAELRTSDMKPSSYKDEDMAYLWAQRMTGAWEIGRGESLPASMPATTAVLQEKGMKSGFSLQQEELGFSISQFMENLILPTIFDSLKDKELLRITGDPKELKVIDNAVTDSMVADEVIKFKKAKGYYPTTQEIEQLKQKQFDVYRKQGRDRWLEVRKKLFKPENLLDYIEVFVTAESFNKVVLAKQLNDLLVGYSNIAGVDVDSEKIVTEIIDLMGLSSERFLRSPEQKAELEQKAAAEAMSKQGASGVLPKGPISETEQVAQANTAERTGGALVPSL